MTDDDKPIDGVEEEIRRRFADEFGANTEPDVMWPVRRRLASCRERLAASPRPCWRRRWWIRCAVIDLRLALWWTPKFIAATRRTAPRLLLLAVVMKVVLWVFYLARWLVPDCDGVCERDAAPKEKGR